MDENRLKILLNQYFNNTISRIDCEELLKHLDEEETEVSSRLIDDYFENVEFDILFEQDQKDDIYKRVMSDIHAYQDNIPVKSNNYFSKIPQTWYRVVAVLVAILSITILLYKNWNSDSEREQVIALITNDILLPNSNSALLTLSDGRTIMVSDSLGLGAQEEGIKVGKSADGSIYYEVQSDKLASKSSLNTFSTPKGHTFQLLLPDGTKVWLNTESTLRFPVAFTSSKRVVELVGEAYFEVAHDPSKPFEVEAHGSLIHVLGTHFNISAYPDVDQVAATLVEGAVDVSRNGKRVALKPGQQALVSSTGAIRRSEVDVNSIMAWRKGYFRFDDESIESIVNIISRWYDIKEIKYEGKFNDRFTGTFQRSKELSQLLTHLEKLSSMRFKIEGRRVVIME